MSSRSIYVVEWRLDTKLSISILFYSTYSIPFHSVLCRNCRRLDNNARHTSRT